MKTIHSLIKANLVANKRRQQKRISNKLIPKTLIPKILIYKTRIPNILSQRTVIHKKWLACSAALLLSACSSTSDLVTAPVQEAVNYDQQRTVMINPCKASADEMALSAANSQSQPQYLNAAKIYRSCSVSVLSNNQQADTSAAMRLFVLSTMNFIKGGDLKAANNMVERFKRSFVQQDYYFANYTSFLDTAEALLQSGPTNAQLLATLNISTSLRQELLRKDYWLKN
ncbi:MAG: hypothetical protein ACSHW0_02140 [Thalassotalea sp.]